MSTKKDPDRLCGSSHPGMIWFTGIYSQISHYSKAPSKMPHSRPGCLVSTEKLKKQKFF